MSDQPRYDTEMIRDFLDHFELEIKLNIENLKYAHAASLSTVAIDYELVEGLEKYRKKYDAVLMPRVERFSESATDEELQAANREIDRRLLEQRESQLRQVGRLKSLLDDALRCARQRGSVQYPKRKVDVTEFVEKMRKGEDGESQPN